jgi:hypothetical protein
MHICQEHAQREGWTVTAAFSDIAKTARPIAMIIAPVETLFKTINNELVRRQSWDMRRPQRL